MGTPYRSVFQNLDYSRTFMGKAKSPLKTAAMKKGKAKLFERDRANKMAAQKKRTRMGGPSVRT